MLHKAVQRENLQPRAHSQGRTRPAAVLTNTSLFPLLQPFTPLTLTLNPKLAGKLPPHTTFRCRIFVFVLENPSVPSPVPTPSPPWASHPPRRLHLFISYWSPHRKELLGGSWVVISSVRSRITTLITHLRGLTTLLITEPPSKSALLGDVNTQCSDLYIVGLPRSRERPLHRLLCFRPSRTSCL